MSERIVHHADALKWLAGQPVLEGCSLVTSLPDKSEFQKMTLQEWREWFTAAAALVLSRTPDDGLALFYQTDIKVDGEWVDKSFLCQKAAEQTAHALIAHKIVCRAAPGSIGFGRPVYSHLLAFSKKIRPEIPKSLADVLPTAGETTWTRGMGLNACRLSCKMIMNYTKSHTVVDPFCGHGAVLAIANEMGLKAIGVDLSLKCVKKARSLELKNLGRQKTGFALNKQS